eukprot:TRINITY_DN14657_c0_g1_i1.p1 TRINITY_DN14657_c0_g1~~TRINITY_DN14657_c0_g1_i1.p1  ORF type:complete len:639 (+),score=130.46 TRINITY_DN14657_c0_g1_i1:229-2145(+)
MTRSSGLLTLATLMVVVLCCFFMASTEAQTKTELFLFQSHTTEFWQINADDAGTQAGEVGFIWMEWDSYPQYHYVTMYQVIVNNTYNEYVPCEEGDTCADRYVPYPKHIGMSDMGFFAMPPSTLTDYHDDLAKANRSSAAHKNNNKKTKSLNRQRQMIKEKVESDSVQYFDFTWYSLPKGGVCPPGEPLGTNRCGFYAPCAVKTVSRACLSQKPGWREAMSVNYYRMFSILYTAFQETEHALGGCPDVTYQNYTLCANSEALLRNPESFGKIPDPRATPVQTKQKRSLPPQEEEKQEQEQEARRDDIMPELSAPLLGINVGSNAICQINFTEPTTPCKPLIEFEPPLNLFGPHVLMSTSTTDGVVFIHLKNKQGSAGCEPSRILGYHFGTNSFVYNFTVAYNFEWFDVDQDDGYLVGLLSADTTVFRMQVVTISLQTHQATVITPIPIYNNSRELAPVLTYDSVNNILYFFGVQGYLSYNVFLSYKLPSFTETVDIAATQSDFNYAARSLYTPLNAATTVFPIILFNYTTITTLSYAPNGNLYAIMGSNMGTYVAGVMDPTTALMEADNVGIEENLLTLRYDQSTFDPISNEYVFCHFNGPQSLARYNVVTRKWTIREGVVDYQCNVLPFRFVYGVDG